MKYGNESKNEPSISVIICTYNRATLLADALQSVCAQQFDCSNYEVIVVDNNSTDDTAVVCEAFATQYPNVYYQVEPKQGLSHARNRGWQVARGDYVAYIDDDCKVPPSWLAVAHEVIIQTAADVFGGPYFPFYNSPKPTWFKPDYGSWTLWVKDEQGAWSQIDEQVRVAPDTLHGGNLFLRRELLALSDGFKSTLGMNGKQMAYGEETALLLHLHDLQPSARFYYEPQLAVYHLVRPEKFSIWWQLYSMFKHGQAAYLVYYDQPREQAFSWLSSLLFPFYALLGSFGIFLHSWLWRNQTHYPYWQNYLYESKKLYYYLHRLGLWVAYVQTGWPFSAR